MMATYTEPKATQSPEPVSTTSNRSTPRDITFYHKFTEVKSCVLLLRMLPSTKCTGYLLVSGIDFRESRKHWATDSSQHPSTPLLSSPGGVHSSCIFMSAKKHNNKGAVPVHKYWQAKGESMQSDIQLFIGSFVSNRSPFYHEFAVIKSCVVPLKMRPASTNCVGSTFKHLIVLHLAHVDQHNSQKVA
jgi:hypothetical protein